MISYNEFHVGRKIRELCGFDQSLYASTGNVIFADIKNVRIFAEKLNALFEKRNEQGKRISAGQLNAMGLIDEIFHYVSMLYRRDKQLWSFSGLLDTLDKKYSKEKIDNLLLAFSTQFPPVAVYQEKMTAAQYLAQTAIDTGTGKIRTNREQTLEELILLHLANENPAFKSFYILFDDTALNTDTLYTESWKTIQDYFAALSGFGPFNHTLITLLREPVVFSPDSLKGQLDYIRLHWEHMIGEWLKRLLTGIDTISEEEKAAWHPVNGGAVEMAAYNYENMMKEYERFSTDSNWMPKVVLLAKTVLVWLDQLSKKYDRPITQLDQIPDEELDLLHNEGFTGLWLIGIWERSTASKRIKQICGNQEAAASAYSLYDYEIAQNIGGWDALANLRQRLWQRGIRLASDMVPNHTGMDSKWIVEKPDLFMQRRDSPFPQYMFNNENLSHDSRVSVYLEDHYYNKSDCAVVFKRVDNQTGDIRYIYHGNDGTGMPWNDTAQIDFLNPEAREEVIQKIIHVAKNFPIIRFDAAMVLAKKHIRRLWYPEPGNGGDIATRSEYALTTQQFNNAIPNEFWREVVDRIAKEVPDTLLLAEAFWMMEGYFVRTLGMHRVYNSAFMNMLKKEENQKYRDTVKNTLEFDPQVLKRFVNFMNNPDEETAVAQFGKGDKYFGVCTLLVTMPGLPMFGHGQVEGFEEKYGMEYTKAYRSEKPDENLVARHKHDIFPLMKKRYLFAQVENFLFYDLWDNGHINENVFSYSNGEGNERTIVFYNNKYEHAAGWIKESVPYAVKTGSGDNEKKLCTRTISEGLNLTADADKYCIFREHRTGLWYIRSSSEICEHGMFVSLTGFEVQVLMDVHQIDDLPDNRYRILCEILSGRGCSNLADEWDEIHYRELYKVFVPFAAAALPAIHALLFPVIASDNADAKLSAVLKEIKPAALAFYIKAAETVAQESGNKKLPSASSQFALFSKLVKKLTILYSSIRGNPAAVVASLKKAHTSDEFLTTVLTADKFVPDIFVCYALVSTLADTGYAVSWSLARKFTEYLLQSGIADSSIRNPLERLFILAENTIAVTASKDTSYQLVKLLVQSENASVLSGVNIFDNTAWFNKELSDTSLAWFAALALLHAERENPAILKLYNMIASAKEKAEYKCTDFAAPFVPKAKKRTTTGKTAKVKTAAKKTTKKSTDKKAPAKKSS
jgi:glycosidase